MIETVGTVIIFAPLVILLGLLFFVLVVKP